MPLRMCKVTWRQHLQPFTLPGVSFHHHGLVGASVRNSQTWSRGLTSSVEGPAENIRVGLIECRAGRHD